MGTRTFISQRTSKYVRVSLGLLCVAVAVLSCIVGLLAFWTLDLLSTREHEATVRQQQINHSMCEVLDQFPAGNQTLDRLKVQLNCPKGAP
jgi:uncharacterized membrane protein YqiK